jgi:GGDEF domain-containing protein
VEQKLSIMVLGESEGLVGSLAKAIESDRFTVEHTITAGLAQISSDSKQDAFVVCLPPGFQPVQENRQGSVVPPHTNVMFVTQGNMDAVRSWAFQQGASDVVSWPLSDEEIRQRVLAMIYADADRFHRDLTEEAMLGFLKRMLDTGVKKIRPVIDASMTSGYYYPAAVESFGRSPYHTIALEQMVSQGVLTRTLVNRVRGCTTCGAAQLNYREVCPKCSSVDIVKTDTVHHFSCGHVGALNEFRDGSALKCPKCAAVVRHIGVDYEKLSVHYHCRTCERLSPETRIETQCMRCTTVTDPGSTLERVINQYELTETASVAVEEGRLGGLNLETVLRGGNLGLYTAQYFEHELMREITRSRRYKTPYCVMLIRLENLDAVRSQHADRAYDYINQVFEALNQGLRVLDTTCIWDSDTLGVLLSSTPQEGGQLVVGKMKENLKALEHLLSIQEPTISVGLISDKDGNESAEAALAAAVADLNS